MRIVRAELARIAAAAARTAPQKAPLAALGCVLLKAADGSLEIAATDYEVSLRLRAPAEVLGEGAALIPARAFADLLRRAPGDEAVLKKGPSGLRLECGPCQAEFQGPPPEDFPSALFPEGEAAFEFDGAALKSVLDRVMFASSKDENHPFLHSVLLKIRDRQAELAATDTYRFAWARTELAGGEGAAEALLPLRAAGELARLLAGGGRVGVFTSGNMIAFRHADFELSSRLIEGEFPNWKTFLPKAFPTRIRIGIAALLGALDRAALIAGKPPVARLKIGEGLLAVDTAGNDGRLEEGVPVGSLEGEPLEIAFNPFFMAEALRALPGGEAEIAFSGPLSAAMFRPTEGGENCFSLLLPVRLL